MVLQALALCSPPVLLIRPRDIISRWPADQTAAALAELDTDPDWKALDVSGQVCVCVCVVLSQLVGFRTDVLFSIFLNLFSRLRSKPCWRAGAHQRSLFPPRTSLF